MNHFKDVCKIVTERAGAMNISLSDNTSLAITLVAIAIEQHLVFWMCNQLVVGQ